MVNRDDIIRMAYEVSDGVLSYDAEGRWILSEQEVIRLTALVAAAEQEAVGNIILDYAGRDDLSDSDESLLKHLFELIRARGEQEQPR